MPWSEFGSDDDVPRFIDAAIELHRPLFDRLGAAERPFFFDWWLRLVNHSHAFLLVDDGHAVALVTAPREEDTHGLRWQVRTLACRDELAGALELPPDVDLARSFTMPYGAAASRATSMIAQTRHQPVQYGYVRSIRDIEPATTDEWTFHRSGADDVEAIIGLLRRGYAGFDDFDPELPRQTEELRQIVEHDCGWCFHATRRGETTPIAMASYVVLHVPLAGVPAALVSDLAVEPEARGRRLAGALQRHAYVRLQAAGLRWVVGNIDPDNDASRRQAERMERTIWYEAVRFYPEATIQPCPATPASGGTSGPG